MKSRGVKYDLGEDSDATFWTNDKGEITMLELTSMWQGGTVTLEKDETAHFLAAVRDFLKEIKK